MSSGSYIICINLSESQHIHIGKLGEIFFQAGYYYYVGSAFNLKQKNALENRVIRHLRPPVNKKIHWHIDYFLAADNISIKSVILVPSRVREECEISQSIAKITENYIEGFGCSDCDCKSHLYYSGEYIFNWIHTLKAIVFFNRNWSLETKHDYICVDERINTFKNKHNYGWTTDVIHWLFL